MLLINSCRWLIEGAAISDPFSHCRLILLVKLCKGGVNSPGAVSAVRTFVPYDGASFAELPTVREGWHYDATSFRVYTAKPPSLFDWWW